MDSMQTLEISPDRIAIAEVMSSITYIPDRTNRNRIHVDVTHIDNPHNFYVRPTKLSSLLPAVQQYKDRYDPSELHTGRVVVYKSNIKSEYIRGQIIKTTPTDECILYDLHTPDHGFIETKIKSSEMWKPFIPDVPPLAQRCLLSDCKPIGDTFSEEAIASMKYFLDDKPADIIVRENTPQYLIVDVMTATSDELSRIMAFTNNSVFGWNNAIGRHYVPKSVPVENTFTYKPLKAGDVLHVRIQYGKSLQGFYVAQMEDYKDYLKIRSDVTYFCKQKGKLDCKNVTEGKVVAVPNAIHSNICERAIIKKVLSPETVTIQLIDWGKTMEVYTSTLYMMTEKFSHIPALAIYCSIEEDEACSHGPIPLLTGYIFNIVIKRVGDKFSSPNIVSRIL